MVPDSSKNTMDNHEVLLDELKAIEKVYGKRVDLYRDVLQVSSQATPPEIQKAFFHRRQELFKVLADKQENDAAEKQMDALVLTYRIIGDAVMRGEYDVVRAYPKSKKNSKKNEPRTVTPEKEERQTKDTKKSNTSSRRYVMQDEEEDEKRKKNKRSTPRRNSSKKNKRKISYESSFDSSAHQSDMEDTAGDTTLFSADTRGTSTVFSGDTGYTEVSLKKSKPTFIQRAADEIEGCIEDTLNAFDQVFHVFTLEERDIRAVTTRIQKAKRELKRDGFKSNNSKK